MSEYQYYEFQAVDRMLSAQEMTELRSYSSRAQITRASFVNHYEWGGFKGNEDRWMDRYFDAFLYLSNFGARTLMLRLPATVLDLAATREYCAGHGIEARSNNGKVVLTFAADLEPDEEWTEGAGILSSILPVRTELARGDQRALYLGWLLAVDAGALEDKALEPPVPPGLRQLSPSLEAVVEFLRLDADLLDIAAQASAPITGPPDRQGLDGWIASLPAIDKQAWLMRVVTQDALSVATEMLHQFGKHRAAARGRDAKARRRTVGELRSTAEAQTLERSRIAKAEAAAERERRKHQAARKRDAYLDSLAGKQSQLWSKVGRLVATTQPANYAAAAVLLVDLRDLDRRSGAGDFSKRLEKLRAAHTRKGSFLKRLAKAGL
ncbi:MAG: hypothetical protein HY899_07085 [Deltaproteobacteria bacterium]|nr:hypothetical protein [Deltaproteobacteria bacterium]